MAKGVMYIDEVQKRVYLGVEAGSLTEYTVQEIHSYIKQELMLSPNIDLEGINIASGNETYNPVTGATTGVVLTMQNGWKLWTEDQGSRHKIKLNAGLVLDSANGDPLGNPINVIWSLSEQSVSSVIGLTSLATDVDDYRKLNGNTQEWVSPGLLKIYDDGETFGGTTYAEFITRDTAGVQTFDISKVRRFERTK